VPVRRPVREDHPSLVSQDEVMDRADPGYRAPHRRYAELSTVQTGVDIWDIRARAAGVSREYPGGHPREEGEPARRIGAHR